MPKAQSAFPSSTRHWLARLVALLALVTMVASVPPQSSLADEQLRKDVVAGTDFRVRLAAALALGKKKDVGAVPVLIKALADSNGSVRAAAAVALGVIGDMSALPALERAKSAEKETSTRQQIEKSIATLQGLKRTRFIVSLGKMENKSGNPKVSSMFQSAVKSELGRVPGIEVVASEKEAALKAKERNLPTIAMDSRLVALSKSNAGADVAVAAKVEFLIRKIPEQSLKATVKGDAKALANSRTVKTDAELGQLQADAVTAAVQSALKGAPTAIEAAAK